jgi:hypothetical protein
MRLKITILMVVILGLSALASYAMAGDPLEKDDDYAFLQDDQDLDGLKTITEFKYGTNPFNSDSDNDGLPDGWEFEYMPELNPADSSDAHLDADFDPSSNGTGFNIGERDATFKAVQKLLGGQLVSWPSNPDVLFITLVFDEDAMHYDNYEEYYRPYTDVDGGNVIRFMHTNPVRPDTDGDAILDPDDYEPLGWANDGTSPGADDSSANKVELIFEEKVTVDRIDPDFTDPYHSSSISNPFDIGTEFSTSESPISTGKDIDKGLLDTDNDGI